MKIYISLPISGRPMDEVRNESEKAKAAIEELGHVPVSPLDVSPNPDAPYSEHIGKDISALLKCDAIVLLEGFLASRGCLLEREAARIYEKHIFYWKELGL